MFKVSESLKSFKLKKKLNQALDFYKNDFRRIIAEYFTHACAQTHTRCHLKVLRI